ncbi:MAG TPA: hypothetical protein VF202_04025 [Trueperaceae bacterium]
MGTDPPTATLRRVAVADRGARSAQAGTLEVPLSPAVPRDLRRRLHVTRASRERYAVPADSFGLGGRLLRVDAASAARIAAALRSEGGAGEGASAALVAASVVLHELMHAVLATAPWRDAALGELRRRLGEGGADAALAAFGSVYQVPGHGGDPAELAEELALLGLAADDAALAPLAALFDPGGSRSVLEPAWTALHTGLAATDAPALPGPDAGGQGAQAPGGPAAAAVIASAGAASLLDLLTLPRRLHPTSLAARLEAALALWRHVLGPGAGELVRRALRALDQLREEERRAPGAGGPPGPPPAWQRAAGPRGEPRYAREEPWMRSARIVAKVLPVWLAQLSAWHGVSVTRLDEVPEEALADLAADGFDTLWLVGVWERSAASRAVKRLQGLRADLGSAYAVHDHVVADALGGEEALARLRERAARHGIRLAADLVANHTAIDSRWVEEHPDWFVQAEEPPFPAYSFTGPDLSPGRPFAVRIEDGYLTGRDAAVVFERLDRATGERRYLYHGNDGTGLPWNDTAQVDFLNPEARRAVVDTVVAAARRFPVLRFDAAMTLVRDHVRRLWHPRPGEGGAVPSRSALARGEEAFDTLLPGEFWAEVVEAVEERAPGTMLIAEAFWLLEEAFVGRLGMHRAYNSAFMRLLASRRDGELRRHLRDVLRRDPRVLERYVNYLTTPDEPSARAAFGAGDRYFGLATLLCTLPGTPLFGHGQAEGLEESYGMEFAAPRMGERPDTDFRERHRRELAPLLRERERFAAADGLTLLRVLGAGGAELERVHAHCFASREGRGAALVAFNHSDEPVAGTLVAPAGPAWEALGLPLPRDGERLVARRHPHGDAASWTREDLLGGWRVELRPFEAVVYLDVRLEALPTAAAAPPAPRRRAPGDAPARAAAKRRARSRRRGGGSAGA